MLLAVQGSRLQAMQDHGGQSYDRSALYAKLLHAPDRGMPETEQQFWAQCGINNQDELHRLMSGSYPTFFGAYVDPETGRYMVVNDSSLRAQVQPSTDYVASTEIKVVLGDKKNTQTNFVATALAFLGCAALVSISCLIKIFLRPRIA